MDCPLTNAIKSVDVELVQSLLNAGAKPMIELDDYASTYQAMKEQRKYSYYREHDVQKMWKENVLQPTLLAVENKMPEIVLKLVESGADIDTVDKDAHQALANIKDNKGTHLHGKSLLEMVQDKIESLEKTMALKFDLPHGDPISLQKDEYYLEDTEPGSYARWTLSKLIEGTKCNLKDWKESRDEQLKAEADRKGKEDRLIALKALKSRCMHLHKKLRKRGAKSLEELHPDLSRRKHDHSDRSDSTKQQVFDPQVKFQVSASDEVLDGYLRFFEAAWRGKNDKIKELTMAKWGPDGKHKPLQASVQDSMGFTAFAIAMYRRHFETAKLLLGIVDAQFLEPDKEKSQRRYVMRQEDSEYDDSADQDSEEGLDISSEVVDDTYTYDIVGSSVFASSMIQSYAHVWWLLDQPEREAMKTAGQERPKNDGLYYYNGRNASATFQAYSSSGLYQSHVNLGRYAIVSRDMKLLRFWLQCCQDAAKMKWKNYKPTGAGYTGEDFKFALQHGHMEAIAELIRVIGAELPIDTLIQSSGVEKAEKPKYYQGLSIGGQKMTAWAKEHGSRVRPSSATGKTALFLQAAYADGLPAVEWFLSDTPLRLYREYRDKHKDDEKLKKLADAPGGFEQAVGSWLKQRNYLSLHAAILSSAPDEKSLQVINYLIAVMPDSIDLPSRTNKLTPLALAFLKGRIDTASALINAGADQTTRDSDGKNLIHLAMIYASKIPLEEQEDGMKAFRNLLELIDKRVIKSLFTERASTGPGGLTPITYWLSGNSSYNHPYTHRGTSQSRLPSSTLTILLDFGVAEAVRMMDGSGQFPLHLAVKCRHTEVVKLLLEHDPALLGASAIEEIWKIIKETAEREPKARVRKLVSVNEAREVARRLADRKKKERTSLLSLCNHQTQAPEL
ncbi:MAG: hypothetical protein L6R37_007692 [Teloschistes peruensis]|nr:MAG: hypothetical protein L6R37_007692 [Teloschistes peruensis]